MTEKAENSDYKGKLEIEKLHEEIKILKRPFYKTPSFWVIVPPVCTLFAAIIVYSDLYSSGVFDLIELEIKYYTRGLN
mgnify:FL=1